MGVVSEILENSMDTVEALTPRTKSNKAFKAIRKADMESLPRVPESHRAFNVMYSDELTIDTSFPWRTQTEMAINRIMDFKMVLRMKGRNVVEALKDAHEDADQIIISLLQVENYTSASASDGRLIMRDINEGPLIEMDIEQGSAILTMSFLCKYEVII